MLLKEREITGAKVFRNTETGYFLKLQEVQWGKQFVNRRKTETEETAWMERILKRFGVLTLQWEAAAAAAKSLQSCPTLCNPIDGSPPGSPVPGILQTRTLEWVAISFSNAWKWKVKMKSLSHVRPSATPWTAAFQAPPSMGFSRQEHWSGLPFPSPMHESEKWKWSCSVVSNS